MSLIPLCPTRENALRTGLAHARRAMLGWCLATALVPTGALQAELGGASGSVVTDQARMRASLNSVQLATHTRHELALPNGGAVHEFVNAQGQIFAISWSGPGKPDLRSLLGSHFADLQAASSAARAPSRNAHALRRPAQVNRSDLQIQTGGHMGYFWGVAILPALAPAGFSASDLK